VLFLFSCNLPPLDKPRAFAKTERFGGGALAGSVSNPKIVWYPKYPVNRKLDCIQKMKGLQLKMARVALGLSVRQAAEISDVSHETITRIEAERGDVKQSTIEKVRAALEKAGVEFIEENGGGPGVRLRKARGK
jgi:DNA-binding XRE family transcriptional regulator